MLTVQKQGTNKQHLCRRSYYNFHILQFVTIQSHLCPGLHAAAKIAIFRVLRKIASLTIFSVTRDFSQFFVMLINTKPDRVADLTKFAKIAKNRQSDDFSRHLQFLAVLCHVKAHFFSCSRSLKCSL